MKSSFFYIFYILPIALFSQIDYSKQWEDLFSYNNVKDFTLVDKEIFAVTDNALFIYNTETKEHKKISSIQGLSGESTTVIHYSEEFNRIIIGYETGLLEIINTDGTIKTAPEIVNFNQTGEKSVNHIFEYKQKLYIATAFAITVYDIEKLEFADTYFIGQSSSDVFINQILVHNEIIYAATKNGIYKANINNTALVDATNWNLEHTGNFTKITVFNNKAYTIKGRDLYELTNSGLNLIKKFSKTITNIVSNKETLTVSLTNEVEVLNSNLTTKSIIKPIEETSFKATKALAKNDTIFIATQKFGILKTNINNTNTFEEIHPDGPLFNDVFAVDAYNNNLWVVYGGISASYGPQTTNKGYSYFNGENWSNTRYNKTNAPYQDMVSVTVDKNTEKAYISVIGQINDRSSSVAGGILEFEKDKITNYFNHLNSPLEFAPVSHPTYTTVRVNGTAIDNKGNLWVANYNVDKKLKKRTIDGTWSAVDLNDVAITNSAGLNEIAIDKSNTIWMGSRKGGVYAYNENGNRKKVLSTVATQGNLPHVNARTVAVDSNNRVWIGTLTGLVVLNNALSIFDRNIYDAEPVIILDDGTPRKLLGDQTVNTITVDGADNKWFGTDNGGVVYTNPSGQKTLAKFTTANSPLPSNKILKIRVDDITGKVYIATDKGLVVYNSKVAPFEEELGEVYAYPNPVLKNHDSVTIDGRFGKHLPKGTNVKILDVAGNLVYETNVVEGQELLGGKVVWNKRNLAGTKVASGVYIVLLSTSDGTQSSSTKIAIVN